MALPPRRDLGFFARHFGFWSLGWMFPVVGWFQQLAPVMTLANLELVNLEPANLEPANLEPANLEICSHLATFT